MTHALIVVRSALLWVVGVTHFVLCTVIGTPLLLLGQRRLDPFLRVCARNIIRLAGARYRVERAPGFDPVRTSLFVANHVDMFDPFFVLCAVPQSLRGLELDAHFRIPFYGFAMRSIGVIGVPQDRDPVKYRVMVDRMKQALDSGTSLAVFPEGTRTLTGRVGRFHPGLIRLAIQLGYPIVPVSIAGAFELSRKGSWLLRPATVTVRLHDTIETSGLDRNDADALTERVREIIARAVE